MLKSILLAVFVFFSADTSAQNDIESQTRPIVAEGKMLYKSEMASWYGTDVFLEHHKDQGTIGGYLSYPTDNTEICIFFSKGDSPVVIGTIRFDSTYNTKTAVTDLTERPLTAKEQDLFTIRASALKIIKSDTLYKRYKNCSLNLIPVISGNSKKVYVLTAPQSNGVMIIGNDYLLNFDEGSHLVSEKPLHKNILFINYKAQNDTGEKAIGAMHTHVPETGEFITATDICTLMLYEKMADWDSHYVFGRKYVSIWNCRTNELITMTTKAFEKISKSR